MNVDWSMVVAGVVVAVVADYLESRKEKTNVDL